MWKKIKLNNSKIYLIIYNKTVDSQILKYLNLSTYLSFLIQTKKWRLTLNIMEEEAILVVNNLVEEEVAQIVLEEGNKMEVVKAVQGIKMHQYLQEIWHTQLTLMK